MPGKKTKFVYMEVLISLFCSAFSFLLVLQSNIYFTKNGKNTLIQLPETKVTITYHLVTSKFLVSSIILQCHPLFFAKLS